MLTRQTSRPRTAENAAKEEEERKAKLARVEAWKKQMAEKHKASKSASDSGAASPAVVADAKGSASPAVQSPSTAARTPTAPDSPTADDNKPASPAPYAGKFDPKAIAKRAAAKLDRSKAALDGSPAIPKSATEAFVGNGASPANSNKVAPSNDVNGKSCYIPSPDDSLLIAYIGTRPSIKTHAKISGFGLNKAGADRAGEKSAGAVKAANNLDDEDEVERKLERLPDLPEIAENEDAMLANGADDQDDGADEIHSDEDEAEAAREAAQRRAQEAGAEQEDVAMFNGEATAATAAPAAAEAVQDVQMEDEEEIDPLDAFMNDLSVPADDPPLRTTAQGKKEAQVFNNSDDEGDIDAVGDGADDFRAMAARRKKKDIPAVDHAKQQYAPFRKAFYSEPVELSDLTLEELEVLRSDLDNITIHGKDAPKPILKWSQGGFGAQILDVIRDLGFQQPTPIQAQTLPAIMSGRDTIGVAKTGSGKTVAYLLPMFRHIKDQPPLEKLDGPIGIVMAPTRELATQIHRDCKPYLKALNLRAVCAYGGAPIKDQIAELKRGAEIVVCTPGRMIDLLAANAGRVTNLKRVTYVVLDEADRMFDMGFEPQITKILNNVRPDRQTVLFSATFPPKMEGLAKKALSKPLQILVGGRSVVADEITQQIEIRSEETKFKRLLELLGDLGEKDEDARSLIFVDRQETADKLLFDLTKRGYPTGSIHGGREQLDRDQAINDFKAGHFPVLVATSVAARGLDVKQLKLVINYDSPNHLEDYVHRAGRTGRAGNTGTAVTFVTPEQDRYAPFLIRALNDSKRPIPEELSKLNEGYQTKVKAGEAKKQSSGFGGRGIERLDAQHAAERARERKQYKTGEEPDEEEDEKDEKTDKKQSEIDKMVAKAAGQVKDRDAAKEEPVEEKKELIPSALADHLSKAMKVEKRADPPPSAGPSGPRANDPLAKVNAAVASINSRLGQKGELRTLHQTQNLSLRSLPGSARPGAPADNRGPDAGAFHATLEINDFPQKARWAVTNRTNVAKILESTGTSITTKGNYHPPGKENDTDDSPKLYILVEGDTELVVEAAMRELTRLLREGTMAALEAESKAPTGGRYSVV